jgi:hypothetical protein
MECMSNSLRYLHGCSGCFRRERFAGWSLHPLEQHRLITAHIPSGHGACSKAVGQHDRHRRLQKRCIQRPFPIMGLDPSIKNMRPYGSFK